MQIGYSSCGILQFVSRIDTIKIPAVYDVRVRLRDDVKEERECTARCVSMRQGGWTWLASGGRCRTSIWYLEKQRAQQQQQHTPAFSGTCQPGTTVRPESKSRIRILQAEEGTGAYRKMQASIILQGRSVLVVLARVLPIEVRRSMELNQKSEREIIDHFEFAASEADSKCANQRKSTALIYNVSSMTGHDIYPRQKDARFKLRLLYQVLYRFHCDFLQSLVAADNAVRVTTDNDDHEMIDDRQLSPKRSPEGVHLPNRGHGRSEVLSENRPTASLVSLFFLFFLHFLLLFLLPGRASGRDRRKSRAAFRAAPRVHRKKGRADRRCSGLCPKTNELYPALPWKSTRTAVVFGSRPSDKQPWCRYFANMTEEKRLSLGINVSILLILMIFGVLLSLPLRLLFNTSYSNQNGDDSVADPAKRESVIPMDHRKLKRCPNLEYEDRLMSVFLDDYDENCTYVQDDEDDDDDNDDDNDDDDDDDDDDDSEEEKDSRQNKEKTGRSKRKRKNIDEENVEEILKSRQMKSTIVAGHILVAMLLVSVIAALVEVLRIRFAREKRSTDKRFALSEKRQVPSLLRKVLAVDAYLTDELVKLTEKFLPLKQLKVHYRVLEISCHGVLWLATSLILIWVFNTRSLYQMQVNLLIGLLLDIVLVAVVKSITRRRRPATNDDPFTLGPDKYSFPSGHASRAAFVAYFFFHLWPISLIYAPPLLAWSFSVCMSRLLMRRHHIIDVVVGIILGILEGLIIGFIYLEENMCVSLISWITDEKVHASE
ncbi:Presqualene diphosphate phosphatase [Ooceraea biroi]|uniref:Presqualene diphosphate phosphatase n=1 Tax=Ooceraea biroi TaxID=2015173 RepID=A0A026WRZ1_OOCBI|nr:Presqualene diphosphate phosphatase [Ooceraea biroi]